ncbi:MAG: hypothetical protein M3Y87_27630 [Myxococcota bacterium]|nr:hypothetical protein [Myxococcota bacterium]
MHLSEHERAARISVEDDAARYARSTVAILAATTVGAITVSVIGASQGYYWFAVSPVVAAALWVQLHLHFPRVLTTRLDEEGLWVLCARTWDRVPWPDVVDVRLGAPDVAAHASPSSWMRAILRPVPASQPGSRFAIVSSRRRICGLGRRWTIACETSEAASTLARDILARARPGPPYRRGL